ncbi:MAG TPA: pirin family protein [Candidatus Sulfotelmatobacter sp.]|nr:pirin family protein [Candidatus Sulfotelmatobacter sp.]
MIQIRPSSQRGGGDHGWLKTHHTFSFSDYWDPKWMGFRSLRVINEDWVAPNTGFPTHPHRDMEIITYVLEGKLEHKDSLGTGSVILPGDGQRMTAGSGIRHSEFNPSTTEPVHLLQIWILPEKDGLQPSYEQKSFAEKEKQGKLRLIASRDAKDGSVKINQDAQLYVSLLKPGEVVSHDFGSKRHGWLQVVRGAVEVNGDELSQGDGAAISDEKKIDIKGAANAEVLLFDLA